MANGTTGTQAQLGADEYFLAIYPRSGLLADIKVTIPLDAFNGTAIIREPADHNFVLRFNVTTTDRNTVVYGLRELDSHIKAFLNGLDRPTYTGIGELDLKDYETAAFLGFGAGFFRDADNNLRFDLQQASIPNLRGLQLNGPTDRSAQADLYLWIESQNRSLLTEGVQRIRAYAEGSEWLRFLDQIEGFQEPDGVSLFGFPKGFSNATVETIPPAESVAFLAKDDEAVCLSGGTYLTHLLYQVDLHAWMNSALERREMLLGLERKTGIPMRPVPRGSLAAMLGGTPQFVRRTATSLQLNTDGSLDRGIMLQVFHRKANAFEDFHNGVLLNTTSPFEMLNSGVLSRTGSGSYYAPATEFTDYAGQEFFEPDLLTAFFDGLDHFFNTRYRDALTSWQKATNLNPRFLWAYIVQSECYHDLGQLNDSQRVLESAAAINSGSHVYLEQLGWQHFLEGDYDKAAAISRQAVAAYYNDSYRSYPLHDLGAALLEAGRAEEAETAFREAASRVNLVVKNCYGLGNALDAQQKNAEAEKIYKRTIEVAQYLIDRGRYTARDLRTEFDLVFIPYSSPRAVATRERVRQLVSSVAHRHFPTISSDSQRRA